MKKFWLIPIFLAFAGDVSSAELISRYLLVNKETANVKKGVGDKRVVTSRPIESLGIEDKKEAKKKDKKKIVLKERKSEKHYRWLKDRTTYDGFSKTVTVIPEDFVLDGSVIVGETKKSFIFKKDGYFLIRKK